MPFAVVAHGGSLVVGLVEMRCGCVLERLTWEQNLFQFPNKRLTPSAGVTEYCGPAEGNGGELISSPRRTS
jgi:hypothetical protein